MNPEAEFEYLLRRADRAIDSSTEGEQESGERDFHVPPRQRIAQATQAFEIAQANVFAAEAALRSADARVQRAREAIGRVGPAARGNPALANELRTAQQAASVASSNLRNARAAREAAQQRLNHEWQVVSATRSEQQRVFGQMAPGWRPGQTN